MDFFQGATSLSCLALHCPSSSHLSFQEYHGKYDPEGGIFKFHALEYIRNPLRGHGPLICADSLLKHMESERGNRWKKPPAKKYSDARFPIECRSVFVLKSHLIKQLSHNLEGLDYNSDLLRSKSYSIKGSKNFIRPYHIRTLPLGEVAKLTCTADCPTTGCNRHTMRALRASDPTSVVPSMAQLRQRVCLEWRHCPIFCNELSAGFETFYFAPAVSSSPEGIRHINALN